MDQVKQVDSIRDWLAAGAPDSGMGDNLMPLLCEKLTAAGIRLARAEIHIKTLHPDVSGVTVIWRPDCETHYQTSPYDPSRQGNDVSPLIVEMYETSNEVREGAIPNARYRQKLAHTQTEAQTDIIVMPLRFSDGAIHAVAWASLRPEGFSPSEIDALRCLMPSFSRVIEIISLRRTSAILLDAYVGNRAGTRILEGRIHRGHSEIMNVAIWLSDMRNFTRLSETLPAGVLVNVLNRYFDRQVPAIMSRGGEVLKFMGDGLLAVFPLLADETDVVSACQRALDAAEDVRASIQALKIEYDGGTLQDFHLGIGLHLGEVLYGNIGGSSKVVHQNVSIGEFDRASEASRLDFTCIGPAINLAARLEKLSSQLGRTIVASSEFARHVGREWVDLGEFTARGFAHTERIFGLPEE